MRRLATRDLLGLWDTGLDLDAAGRALVLAGAVRKDSSVSETGPIGHVTARILSLRSDLLGVQLTATAVCPGCTAQAELPIEVGALLSLEDKIIDEPAALEMDGYFVRWRPMSVLDLRAASRHDEPVAAESELLRRCVIKAVDTSGARRAADQLPDRLRDGLADAMEAADPLAEVLVAVTCPECLHPFDVDFDAASYVWSEVDQLAREHLIDVHTLARAYGWTEDEVLSLSESRRATYLRIIRTGAP